ncbi:MAG: flagellar motor switch protein FliM, partial [Rhabdochlamydiaceae bacterium]
RQMSEILSQEDIESLLYPFAQEAAPIPSTDPTPTTPAPGGHSESIRLRRTGSRPELTYEIYDFRRPDKFSKDQLRTLQMINETFARLAGSTLSASLRCPVNVDLISLEQIPYEEYLRSINQSVFTIISLPPLSGQAVLEMEFGLIFSMIDRMLGGPGKAISRTNLTDIEKPLVRQLIERLFQALKGAWEGIVVVNPGIDGLETSSQFVQIAPPNDIVITILFEVKIGTQRNAMSLCIPYLLLKPVTTKLSGQKWFNTGNRRQSSTNRKAISNELCQTQVECAIHLGVAKLKVKEFLDLEKGQLLRLDQKIRDDLELRIEEVPKYYGRPALQGKKLVFSVTNQLED